MKALVYYGTRYGGTAGIAQTIYSTLQYEGFETSISKELVIDDLVQFDLVIVGNGIEAGKWTDNTLVFLDERALSGFRS